MLLTVLLTHPNIDTARPNQVFGIEVLLVLGIIPKVLTGPQPTKEGDLTFITLVVTIDRHCILLRFFEIRIIGILQSFLLILLLMLQS